jgi:hypothetical protein
MKPKRMHLARRGKSRAAAPRPRPATPPAPPLDREVAKKLLELWKLPREKLCYAFLAWLQSAGTPKLIAEREQKVQQILDYSKAEAQKDTPRQPRMGKGSLKRPLPIEMVRDAFLPHRRAFPIFVGKVLDCKPHSRSSRLTLKHVHQLKAELDRLKNFRCGDHKIDQEMRHLRAQLNQIVRGALKFSKSTAM